MLQSVFTLSFGLWKHLFCSRRYMAPRKGIIFHIGWIQGSIFQAAVSQEHGSMSCPSSLLYSSLERLWIQIRLKQKGLRQFLKWNTLGTVVVNQTSVTAMKLEKSISKSGCFGFLTAQIGQSNPFTLGHPRISHKPSLTAEQLTKSFFSFTWLNPTSIFLFKSPLQSLI